jgi:Bor protein
MIQTRLARISLVTVLAFATVLSAACYKHSFVIGAGASAGQLIYDHWENFWIAGLIGKTDVTVAQMCPSGNATIEAKQTFLNGLVSALTSGIYTPTTLRIRCQDGRQAEIALTSEDVARIVHDDGFGPWVDREAPELSSAVRTAQILPTAH